MTETLNAGELIALVARVFVPTVEDVALGVMIDLPDAREPDDAAWMARRRMAAEWVELLDAKEEMVGYRTRLLLYPNVHTNNGDLPDRCWIHEGGPVPQSAADLDPAGGRPMRKIFDTFPMLMALTRFSSTAPLKMAARKHSMRAATMPGFSADMIPALRINYTEVNRRVDLLKGLLDSATGADLVFRHPGGEDRLHLDLRHRTGHASGGLLPLRGVAGNLPSGEAYIVPYEGEVEGDPSRSEGVLPVQFGSEIVRYEIVANRAVRVLSHGPESEREAALLAKEPAYANLAELGLGVLAAFGIKPVGAVLLDEKLGLHIAFGRSEHFGGQVGPEAFSSPDAVVHIDRVYVKETQPDVVAASVDLQLADGTRLALMRDGDFGPVF
ncbi:MAG: M29 family metallopeptidase [Gemmatimonadaceae bacterium]